jgi:hypothetical protein
MYHVTLNTVFSVAVLYMCSYYAGSMTHAPYIWVMITGMGIFIGCGYGSHTEIDVTTLKGPETD